MAITTAIGSSPNASTLSGISIDGLLAGKALMEGAMSSGSTRPSASIAPASASTTGATRAEISAMGGVAALRQGLFDAGRPNALGAAQASRSEHERAMEAKLAATIASYLQH